MPCVTPHRIGPASLTSVYVLRYPPVILWPLPFPVGIVGNGDGAPFIRLIGALLP